MNTTAQVGGALGLAVLASVASSHAHGSHTLSAIAVAFTILKDPAHTPDHEAVNDQRYLPTVAAED